MLVLKESEDIISCHSPKHRSLRSTYFQTPSDPWRQPSICKQRNMLIHVHTPCHWRGLLAGYANDVPGGSTRGFVWLILRSGRGYPRVSGLKWLTSAIFVTKEVPQVHLFCHMSWSLPFDNSQRVKIIFSSSQKKAVPSSTQSRHSFYKESPRTLYSSTITNRRRVEGETGPPIDQFTSQLTPPAFWRSMTPTLRPGCNPRYIRNANTISRSANMVLDQEYHIHFCLGWGNRIFGNLPSWKRPDVVVQ